MKRILLTNLLRVICMIIPFLISDIGSADSTHMGVEPAEMVSLVRICEEKDSCSFKRTTSYGGMETDSFKIPEGKVLVVTEFDWRYVNGAGFGLEDQLIEFDLIRGSLCELGDKPCAGPPVRSFAVATQYGQVIGGAIFASGTLQMTTGFVISIPAHLGVNLKDMFGNHIPTTGEFTVLDVTVRGYLITPTCGLPGTPPCR
ncbi:MAG TPA: hypothetical protein VLH08_14365 [Acidobacteriota bacterium]|nr:hypothetical protein [Acidobacteriota bacterium]